MVRRAEPPKRNIQCEYDDADKQEHAEWQDDDQHEIRCLRGEHCDVPMFRSERSPPVATAWFSSSTTRDPTPGSFSASDGR